MEIGILEYSLSVYMAMCVLLVVGLISCNGVTRSLIPGRGITMAAPDRNYELKNYRIY